MRHAIILGLASLFFAALMSVAWQFDQARNNAAQAGQNAEIDAGLDRLESQYLTQARTLLSLTRSNEALLANIDAALAALSNVPPLPERDEKFQALTGQIRTALLGASTTRLNELQLQEWRRAQDQMNGALNRRQHLLKQSGIITDAP